MSLRFAFVLAVLAALHAYIGLRLLPALPIGLPVQIAGGIMLAASWVVMPMGLVARGMKNQTMADRLTWAGMLAMGLFSSLLMLTVARDVVLMIYSFVATNSADLRAISAAATVCVALAVTLAGFFNARRLAQVRKVDVPIANLPAALHGFSIAQISDIHVGPTIKGSYLNRIVDRVNALGADLVAVTGDVVDGSVTTLRPHTEALARLRARHGAYLVTGNHEYYSNAHAWIAEFRRLGLSVLMNEHRVLQHDGAQILVAGVTDFSAHHFDPKHKSDPHAALSGAPDTARPKLLLAHQPRSAPAAAQAGFDLQISGHTHGGQFWPWNLFVPLQQPYIAGLHKLDTLWIYVSRGTGYWGPPKRFGAPSEITLLRLVSA